MSNVLLMAFINICFSDLTFRGNYRNPRYWCEVMINGFGSIFVNNNVACFHDVELESDKEKKGKLVLRKNIPFHYKMSGSCPKRINKMRVHRPSFCRHVVFEAIIIAEMFLMLYTIMTVNNPSSLINNDVKLWREKIVKTTALLYMTSLLFKVFYYKLHPWPLKYPRRPQIQITLENCMVVIGIIVIACICYIPVLSSDKMAMQGATGGVIDTPVREFGTQPC